MEDLNRQQLLVAPETNLERTLRTGKIDFLGLSMRQDMPELVTLFDDAIERPEHYYDQSKNIMAAASNLGSLMVRKALRALGEGTIGDVQASRKALWPSFYKHLGYSFGPFDPSANLSDDTIYDMQKGLERQRAAYNLLMDPRDTPGSGYEFNVLRSCNGLGAKALCMIVDAPQEVLMQSELESRFEQTDTLKFLLDSLVKLQVIEIDPELSRDGYLDPGPPDRAYRSHRGWRCRTEEDSELMALARHHAQKYDEYAAADKAATT